MELNIRNLNVNIDDKSIIKALDLDVKAGEIHALMGPNGAGKSTLLKAIMGDYNYQVSGSIKYNGEEITNMSPDKRSHLGIYLGMQLPPEVEGVSNADFLRTALREKDPKNFKLFQFVKDLENTYDKLELNKNMIHRHVNLGFSGGERKKNEIVGILMLKPNLILLDEIDSGLDVDALKLVGNTIMEYYEKEKPAIILITHYERLLDYIKPTHVHVMQNGKIVTSGNQELINNILKEGYNNE